MDPITVSGLSLTERQYAIAAEGLATHATALFLTWEQFTRPAAWWIVPDGRGLPSKAEYVVTESEGLTVKINLWLAPDLRHSTPRPHSHPWDFRSHILAGGYTEDRYTLDEKGTVDAALGNEHAEGTINRIDREIYHEVTELHTQPGDTMTLMVCGRGVRGRWGYLDPATGRVEPASRDPRFLAHLRALNPHQQP